ncbi:MAG: hypothetical protein Q4D16_17175 [Eubacteriales bacterium]|nr:hypothetical protein [Eubacteriales bacterium]
MSTIIDLMFAVRKRTVIFYHKDTKQFDYYPCSEIEREQLSSDLLIPYKDLNNCRFLSYEDIDHEGIMRFYVREYVEDKAIRKLLFGILRRDEYLDAFLNKLQELSLYDDFIEACGDVYVQMFDEWADKNGLDFEKG